MDFKGPSDGTQKNSESERGKSVEQHYIIVQRWRPFFLNNAESVKIDKMRARICVEIASHIISWFEEFPYSSNMRAYTQSAFAVVDMARQENSVSLVEAKRGG